MPVKHYAVLKGGPGDMRVVVVERGQSVFLLPEAVCKCGAVIDYEHELKETVRTFKYVRTSAHLKDLPVFSYVPGEE